MKRLLLDRLVLSAKVTISVLLLAYIFFKVDVSHVLNALTQLSLVTLVVGFAAYIIFVIIAAYRWHLLLPDISLRNLLRFSFVGQFYSFVLPGQFAGEAMKAYRLTRTVDSDVYAISSSVFVDKTTGLLGLLVVFVYGLMMTSLPVSSGIQWGTSAFFGAVLIGFLSFGHKWVSSLLTRALGAISTRFNRAERLLEPLRKFVFAAHFHVRRTPTMLVSIGLGMTLQLIGVWVTSLVASDMGIVLSFAEWCWIFGAVSVLVLLPITIAGLGVRELSFVGILSIFGIPTSLAVALSFAILGFQIAIALIGGLIELFAGIRHTFR